MQRITELLILRNRKRLNKLMINAWQWGFITWWVLLSFHGARLGIGAPTVTLAMLLRMVIAVFLIALRQIHAQNRLTTQFLLDFFEAQTALGFLLGGTATRAFDFGTGGRIDAPGVTGRGVVLFGFVESFGGAARGVEAGGGFATARLQDLGVAWALFDQSAVHVECYQKRGSVAWFGSVLTRSNARAGDLFAGVTIDAPTLTGRSVMLGGFE